MKITTEDLIRQATALEMNAQAMLLHARVFRAQVIAVLTGNDDVEIPPHAGVAQDRAPDANPEVEQGGAVLPASDPLVIDEPPVEECKCPANRRRVCFKRGFPQHTKCSLCDKEFD